MKIKTEFKQVIFFDSKRLKDWWNCLEIKNSAEVGTCEYDEELKEWIFTNVDGNNVTISILKEVISFMDQLN